MPAALHDDAPRAATAADAPTAPPPAPTTAAPPAASAADVEASEAYPAARRPLLAAPPQPSGGMPLPMPDMTPDNPLGPCAVPGSYYNGVNCRRIYPAGRGDRDRDRRLPPIDTHCVECRDCGRLDSWCLGHCWRWCPERSG
ncbi:hypothetical protein MNEG_9333 [Monoraphidium neglectum]|uniref:Uncharacterized protein n=1 Tax=Monoraphidium neglectum TaxID=145388 RepID=A0A0D2KT10_9CHLO|nr:hypothetical protein MNEG_9333 [Monoraphidium neglectum]KIY98628.1 hypothetical protein MNEG_9333 [Monoraphidium neglectum]|eukprot:XP_013897648.1 hypothetical protein MNEG_9333 [Monoraphidium neglectum]